MIPDAAAAGSFAATACRARPVLERDEVRREEQRDADEPPDDGRVSRPDDLVTADGEPLRHGDAELPAREPVLGVEQRPGDQRERQRGEREVMAAETHQRDADHHRDGSAHERRDGHGEQRVDAGLGIDEPRVRVETHRQQPRRVRTDEEEASLAERHLACETHEQRQADHDERVQPHAVVQPDVALLELERQPARKPRRGDQGEEAYGANAAPSSGPCPHDRVGVHTASSPRERQPMRMSITTSAMMRLYWGSTYPITSCSTTPSA